MERAMLHDNGYWSEIDLSEALSLVAEGKAERRESWDKDYDDGLPTFNLFEDEDDTDGCDLYTAAL